MTRETRTATGTIRSIRSLGLAAASLSLALALLAGMAGSALGGPRTLYVANGLSTAPGVLPQFSLNLPNGKPTLMDLPPVEAGDSPQHVALTPDGRFAYASSAAGGEVRAYTVGADGGLTPHSTPSVPAGIGAHGMVVSPDGRSAYVGNQEPGTVSQFDLAPDGTISPKPVPTIDSGPGATGVAVAADGRSLYVTNLNDSSVSQFKINRKTGQLTRLSPATVRTPLLPSGLAGTPDGRSLYVVALSGNIAQFTIGKSGRLTPKKPRVLRIGIGLGADGVAIDARGRYLYVPNAGVNTISQLTIDPRNGRLARMKPAQVRTGARPEGVAIAPNGRALYVANAGDDEIRWLSIRKDGRLAGMNRAPIPASPGPHGLVVSPDQSPVARLARPAPGRVGDTVRFDASRSRDSDGRVARYRWSFGDGKRKVTATPRPKHRYRKPGVYRVRVTVVDDEGCSKQMVYTGQTALCSGGNSTARTKVRVGRH